MSYDPGQKADEPPVNPYSLLEAVNSSSDTGHTGWLIFLGLMAYLMVAVAGVTHKDLLLETPVALPILQVHVQQAQFFQFAPVLLVLFHIGLVSQLVLLARKALELDRAVAGLEPTWRRTHPLRLELHNFFFVQAIAGPTRSRVMSLFLHGMSWLTLVVLPVVLLLYIQIKFLPYHDVKITWTHRIALVTDIVMLILIGVFLTRSETSFFQAYLRTGLQHPLGFLLTCMILAVVTFFSFFIATVPGEMLDRLSRPLLDDSQTGSDTAAATGFRLPFLQSRVDGSLFGIFHRNLIATDLDLVPDDAAASRQETTINLRGRDLRFARLDRSDLHQADLTGANLDGASLTGANLQGARLKCADVDALILAEDRVRAGCASARGARFDGAQLAEAQMTGIDIRAAHLSGAQMEAVELAYALAAGADFTGAQLDRVEMTGGAQLQSANFLVASLRGADLTGAHLQGAGFGTAAMQGAILRHADLRGADLRDADLEAADLQRARLEGAQLTGAQLRAADLRWTGIWMTRPPAEGSVVLADISAARIAPPSAADDNLASLTEPLETPRARAELEERLAGLRSAQAHADWALSEDYRRWQKLVALTQPALLASYPNALTTHLSQLICRSRFSTGAVAAGVTKRALRTTEFRGLTPVIHQRLTSADCPASKTIPPKLLQSLSNAVDITLDD